MHSFILYGMRNRRTTYTVHFTPFSYIWLLAAMGVVVNYLILWEQGRSYCCYPLFLQGQLHFPSPIP